MWDQRYSEAGFAYGTEPNDFLKAEYSIIPEGGRVLCLAEGEGRNAVFLARLGYQVTAVDQSSVGLEKAGKLALDHGVEIETIVADLNDFDLGVDQWDGIVSIWAHVPETLRHQLHKQVVAALKKNGVFLLEAYTVRHIDMEGVGGPPPEQADFFMSLDQLYSELEGLEMVHAVEIDRMISEGNYHVGESAVVQVVARKPDQVSNRSL
jgi:SAM-dependent methyltransferase